ncbi:MAG: beta-galactosidase [Anaerolineae bacterium]
MSPSPSGPEPRPARRYPRRRLFRAAALGTAVAVLGTQPRPLVALGPQQQVATCNPKLGVHTRLTDEVEEWKVKRTLEMVREMGARWVVEYFPWAYCEPRRGVLDWSHADTVIAHAARQGLTVVARLGFVPDWALPADACSSYLTDDAVPAFAAFCERFARRYAGVVGHVVVWNEPNLAQEWGFRPPSPEGYAALLAAAYPAIKAGSGDTTVLAGALAPMPAPLDDPLAMDDLTYLERLYAAGATPHFDALAAHAYGWVYAAADEPDAAVVSFRRTELLRRLMVEHGDGAKPCFVTEGGWNDHPRWTRAVSAAERVTQSLLAYDLAWRQWDWCESVALWAFRFPWPQRSYQDYFSFVSPDFAARPIYAAVQEYAQDCVLGQESGARSQEL